MFAPACCTTAALLTLLLAMTGGCISHVHYPLDARLVTVSRPPSIQMFEYQRTSPNVVLDNAAGRAYGYNTHSFSMSASFENGQPRDLLTGTYYDSGLPGRKPLIVVLPVWGVTEYPSIQISRDILKRSDGQMNVLRVDGHYRLIAWKDIERSSNMDEFVSNVTNAAARLRHAVIDARRLLDWAGTRKEIDPDRIGLVGFSVSAVTGSLVMQSDNRVAAGALIMGGARLGKIVASCPGNEQSAREAVIRTLSLSLEQYERTITSLFEGLDPTDYPNRVNPQKILITDAAKDECIPEQARNDWWEALGKPERLSFNYTHRGSFLAMTPLGFNFLRKRIYQHLTETLGPES